MAANRRLSRNDAVGLGSAPASGAVADASPATSEDLKNPHHLIPSNALEPTGTGASRDTRGRVCSPFFLIASVLFLAESLPSHAADSFEAKVAALWNQLPQPQTHYAGVPETEAAGRHPSRGAMGLCPGELQGSWFAARPPRDLMRLYSVEAIRDGRVDDFLLGACARRGLGLSEQGKKPRRIPAASWPENKNEQPTFVTITYRDNATAVSDQSCRVRLQGGSGVLAAVGYRRHRDIQLAAREALGRDPKGRFNATFSGSNSRAGERCRWRNCRPGRRTPVICSWRSSTKSIRSTTSLTR